MSINPGHFVDGESNRRCAREQEGFARTINFPPDEAPACGSFYDSFGVTLADFRGPVPTAGGKTLPDKRTPWLGRQSIEWETSPAESAEETAFTFIAGSQVRPVRPAFPYATATLWIDGVERLRFPLGWTAPYSVAVDGLFLAFEPRRFQSLVEGPHRNWSPHGVSGFYRLGVPAKYLRAGKPLTLRVAIDKPPEGTESVFYLSPRTDALRVNLTTLRDEVAQLQADVSQLRASHEMLYAKVFPELFPQQLKGERVVVHSHDDLHYHPPSLTVLRSGEVIITVREGSDHLSNDGRIVLFRSRDGGRTWGPRELLYDLGKSDHRCAPIFELPDGDWLTTDYRAGSEYTEQGVWSIERMTGPSLWGAWSSDQGRTWSYTDKPMTVPGMHPYAEVERHMIQLPSGRLLVAANYMPFAADGVHPRPHEYQIAVFASDDRGRHWEVFAHLPNHPFLIGECTMLRTRSGRILMLSRSQPAGGHDWTRRGALLQSVSLDEGKTWSPFEPTTMSSMGSPGHLLQLADGRILCTHASRHYPGSIYATTSDDEGRTWNTRTMKVLTMDIQNFDACYPTSGQLPDGTIVTTWYANLFGRFYVAAMRYGANEL